MRHDVAISKKKRRKKDRNNGGYDFHECRFEFQNRRSIRLGLSWPSTKYPQPSSNRFHFPRPYDLTISSFCLGHYSRIRSLYRIKVVFI